MIDIIKYFNFPNSTLIERKLFKKQFLDNFSLTTNEKKILSECVDSITLNNLLNKDSINILPFKNETHSYQEIAVISVEIKNQNKSKEIANIILHIPYPVILILVYKEQIQINISPKRLNVSDVSKLVVEEQYFTKWIDFKNLTSIDETFLHSLNINNHSFRNFLAFYESFIDKLISYNASIYSGIFSISKDTKMILENIQKTEAQIIDIKNKIKKETNFNDKVNMNMQLKNLNDKLKILKEDLK
jgi:hypothetical protein